jgi:hypothetical protein
MILGAITDLIYMVVISLYTGGYFLTGRREEVISREKLHNAS